MPSATAASPAWAFFAAATSAVTTRQGLQLLFIFIQIPGAILVESVTAQTRAEGQMRRQLALLDLAAFGRIDLECGRGLARRVQPADDLRAQRLQPLFVQRFGLAQPHQQQARGLQAGRRQHFQELPGLAGEAGEFQRPRQRAAAGLVGLDRRGQQGRRLPLPPPPRLRRSLAVTSADATKEICMLYLRTGTGYFGEIPILMLV